MNTGVWVAIFLLFFVLWQQRQQQNQAAATRMQRKKGGRKTMSAMVETYIGKDCIVYTLNNAQICGIIRDVQDGWLRIETEKGSDVINLDYIIRVREYPKNKKGKRAAIVAD